MGRVLEYFGISTQLTNVLGTLVKNCLQCVLGERMVRGMEIYKGRKLLTSIVWEKRKKMRGEGRRNHENFPESPLKSNFSVLKRK